MNKPLKYGLFLTFMVIVAQIATILIYELIAYNRIDFSWVKILIMLIVAVISSVIIVVAILNIVPYLKQFILNDRSFLRFQSLSHPLLLRLSFEAPGTYHHSLMVANLSYQAAKKIKADAILTRIGSYYHDIGKLENPEIFIENQSEPSSIESESLKEIKERAKKIIDHVNYGLKLAKIHNLPPKIMAFIAEHHGTTVPQYFFNKAKKLDSKISLKEFTYPGPKPLSPESAIVMLSDAIEATLRLIKDINKNKIIENVNTIMNERISQNQLELSGLTKDDLNKIKISFIETLSNIHHQRINYSKV